MASFGGHSNSCTIAVVIIQGLSHIHFRFPAYLHHLLYSIGPNVIHVMLLSILFTPYKKIIDSAPQ
jgi:hypothetical protein